MTITQRTNSKPASAPWSASGHIQACYMIIVLPKRQMGVTEILEQY